MLEGSIDKIWPFLIAISGHNFAKKFLLTIHFSCHPFIACFVLDLVIIMSAAATLEDETMWGDEGDNVAEEVITILLCIQ